MIFCVLIAFKYPDFWNTFHNFQVFPSSIMSPSLTAALFRIAALVPCLPSLVPQPGNCPWSLTRKSLQPPTRFLLWMPEISQPLTRTSLGLHVHPQAAAGLRISLPPPAPGADRLCPCPQRPPSPCGVIIHILYGFHSLVFHAERCKVIISQFHIWDLCLHLPTLGCVWMEADNSAFMKPFLAQPHD